ncbi:ubiquitin carrier protein [Thecamonas trahens ATCC 50062]|uniref:Ubiquitin carrier protein n=1 Tax=Thecamonas trahens ATCC 50062 TaxID=461836 RepID=A0A0L0DAU7_THETB|nr:ubiquitin carrier protein [Thecamonas trahens ATCC 50062]KNC49360.1 ubiquitin carrier protein [Thecamonas trahens ATCC 50062]|eukprot:XP_013757785.1 ubiquitin carrier protein [Thecamonas trahens ATCC 50062]
MFHRPTHAHPSATSAVRRLMREWKEIAGEEFEGASIAPSEQNMLEWHANITTDSGPYAGAVIHLVLDFPVDYPSRPPAINLASLVWHPNVFRNRGRPGYYVCLDMLKHYSSSAPFAGWSSAYSIAALVRQLQSFLLAERIPQDDGTVVDFNDYVRPEQLAKTLTSAASAVCSCGHSGSAPWPPLCGSEPGASAAHPATDSGVCGDVADRFDLFALPAELIVAILCKVDRASLVRLAVCSRRTSAFINDFGLLARSDLVCFHTKLTVAEDVMGIPLAVARHRSGAIREITSTLDVISWTAFSEDGLRTSAWGGHFQYFLPLAIDALRFDDAYPVLLSEMSELTGERDDRVPAAALRSLITFAASLIVGLMTNATSKTNDDAVPRGVSDKALRGFCWAHHLMLALVARHPELVDAIEAEIEDFVTAPQYRHKRYTRSLGEFIVKLLLSRKHKWRVRIWKLVLLESLDRQVLWATRTYAQLHCIAGEDRLGWKQRAQLTFNAAETGIRLIAFQVYFLHLLHPASARVGDESGSLSEDSADPLATALHQYNARSGAAATEAAAALSAASKRIAAISSWNEYFTCIGAPPLPLDELGPLLERAVASSARRGYHTPPQSGLWWA